MGNEGGQMSAEERARMEWAYAQGRNALIDYAHQSWDKWSAEWPEIGAMLARMVVPGKPDRATVEELIATAATWTPEHYAGVIVWTGCVARVVTSKLEHLMSQYRETNHAGPAWMALLVAEGYGHCREVVDTIARVSQAMDGEDAVAILGAAAILMRRIGFTPALLAEIPPRATQDAP